jgi:hypothetical protein
MDTKFSAEGQGHINSFMRYYEKLTMWEKKPKIMPQKI